MKKKTWLVRPIAVAVGSCFGIASSWGNPTGPQVMHGNVQMQGLGTNALKVTSSPGSIIHWQGFSIGAGAVTQFVQQSGSSSVLNRVVGADISQIYGQLLSNGRVFLINPAGILIGAGAVIDTAGFVGSTLRMLDGDFLAGKLKFEGGAGAGSIVNQGWIKAGQGGNVVLIAPNIENSGVIQTEGGQIVLAAGQKLTIGSMDFEGVQFEIQAPTDSVLNVGKLLADGGAVGVFAGTLKHSGDIRANALTRDEAGRIVLKAQGDVTLAAGSTTTANGSSGGNILVQSVSGQTRISGSLIARGDMGRGGDIKTMGERVALVERAAIDASGSAGGGQIRIGGDYQGANIAIQNASRTSVGPDTTLRADAEHAGDGGRVIVWADTTTQYAGTLSARGGPKGGNGGFAEVSGKENLVFVGRADLSAAKGALGTLLLDPLDLFVANVGGAFTSIIDETADVSGNAVTITPAALAAVPGNVVLQARRYMRFVNDVNLTRPGQSLTATVDVWTPTDPRGTPPNRMELAANITTAGGAVSLRAPSIQSFNSPTISTMGSDAPGAGISLISNDAINPNNPFESGTTLVSLNAGIGAIDAIAGALTPSSTLDMIRLNTLIGGNVTVTAPSLISTNAITTTGPVRLTSTGNPGFGTSLTVAGNMVTGNGDVTIAASGGNASVSTRAIDAGRGAVEISAQTSITTSANPITTTNRVNLTTAGNTGNAASSINARVNNGGAVTAVATSSTTGNASATIGSDTDLNAANVSATATTCSNSFTCQSATVNLSATGSVNVGTVAATALRSAANNVSESVSITSGANAGAAIMPMAAASQVKAVNVSLSTVAGTGGGIGSAAVPLVVTAERNLTLSTNGAFDVVLNGPTINQFDFRAGVAPAGGSYTGRVQRPTGGLSLTASATDSTVTIDSPTFAGFNQRVFNANPSIAIRSSTGALNVPTLVVPEGDITVPDPGPPAITTIPLPVTIQAAGNLTLGSYTRQSSAASQPKSTSIFSNSGTVTLGSINASRDAVFVSGPAGVTISAASLTSQGAITVSSSTAPDGTPGPIVAGKITSGGTVQLFSTTGNIAVGEIDAGGSVVVSSTSGNISVSDIDTSTGGGGVTLAISCAVNNFFGCGTNPAIVSAAPGKDDALFEVRTSTTAAGASINVTAQTIGTAGFTNPLDLQSRAITLTSIKDGGRIGFDAAAVQANAPNLTIVAADASTFTGTAGAKFNVSTGVTALQNLLVTANPAIAAGGISQIRSESRTYDFVNNGTSMGFNPGTVPGSQFMAGGVLSLTTNRGDIGVTSSVNMGAGQLALDARSGDIAAENATFDGAAFMFAAGSGASNARTDNQIRTNAIGGVLRPDAVTMTAGSSGFVSGSINGSVENTGGINSRDVSLTTFRGRIRIGATGTDNIGSSPGGAISISALPNSNTNGFAGAINVGNIIGSSVSVTSVGRNNPLVSNPITTGNITADSISIANLPNTITTGSLDAAASIDLRSRVSVTTGALDSPSIVIDRDSFLQNTPVVQVNGAIGATRPVTNASLVGAPLTITGAVTGNANASIDLLTNGTSALTVGGPITAGVESRINLLSRQGFDFSRIDAGSGESTAIINAGNGPIRQTVDGGPNGITARNIELNATAATGAITNIGAGGTDPVDLFNVARLTVNTPGRATFDAHGSTLSALTLTKGNVATAPFALQNLSGQTVEMSTGAADATLRVNSPTRPLNFSLTYTGGGLALVNEGIVTSGGNVFASASGDFNGTIGGVRTGGALGGGIIDIRARNVTTGTLDTTPTATGAGVAPGDRISVSSNAGTGNILVNGNLLTGPAGGQIELQTGAGSITRTGPVIIRSDGAYVSASASGDLGTPAAPLLITSPSVTLRAGGSGRAFATLTGTNLLDLRGDEGFNVGSDLAFNTLTVAAKGSGTGPLTLTAPGQTFAFARPTTDNFGAAITAFQVVTANMGASQPATNSATFRPTEGDLFIGGGASISVPNLNLDTFITTGDIRLQGNAGSALVLSNPNQTINSSRDVLITGNATITGGATQSIFASRDITVVAQQGTAALNAPTQRIASTGGAGSISFLGGSGAGESVTISASERQHISTPAGFFSTGRIRLQGGDGSNASVTLAFNGVENTTLAGRDVEQQLEAGGQIRILGGNNAASTGSFALVTGNQRQTIRALGNGAVTGEGSIQLTGGAGTRATARIVGTGNILQQVAEGRCFFVSFSCVPEPYQTPSLTLQGGGGVDSFAEIVTVGQQQVFPTGTLALRAGTATGTFARIENATANGQDVGNANFDSNNTLIMTGGPATNTYARISAAGPQTIRATSSSTMTAGTGEGANVLILSTGPALQRILPGNLTLTGGGSTTTTARAEIQAAGSQLFTSVFALSLNGGSGIDSFARVDTPGDQSISLSSLAMSGGTAPGAFAKIDAGGNQRLTGSFAGAITLQAGGTLAAPLANVGAIVEGHSQSLSSCGFFCNVTLTGGAGVAAATSDAVFRNLSGDQSFSAGSLTINGGITHSTAGLLNPATGGTQAITTSNTTGIRLSSDAAALANAFARIENLAPTPQTITSSSSTSSGGGLALNNRAAGLVGVTSAGAQTLQSQFVDLTTAAGSTGDATLSATGNQFIRTTNGTGAPAASLRVAALGSGTASITATARQLLELEYFERFTAPTPPPGNLVVGNAAGAGASLIAAPDQSIFASSMALFGGSGGGTAAITSTSTQALSAIAGGGLSLSAGSGPGASATISAPSHDIVVSGAITLTGSASPAGSPANALLRSVSGPQIVTAGSGGITLNGDAAAQADSLVAIQNLGVTTQTLLTPNGDVRLEGRAAGTVALTSGGMQTIDARAVDVLTRPGTGPLTGANASIIAAGDQAIHTSGALGVAPGVGMRVAALGTGTAKIQSAGAQTLSVGHPEMVEGQLLIGRLAFGPPGVGDPAAGTPAAGDSLVIAPNQIVRAGSVYIQGPSSADRISKLSADATQTITTYVAGITVVGGSALNALATIDPTNQTITSFGPILLQGGSGPNADAIINATGPQSVISQNGPVTLMGGAGSGADALIVTTSPFQTVQGQGGSAPVLIQGPAGGGAASVVQGANVNTGGQLIAANNATNEVQREQDDLDRTLEASETREEERQRRGAQLCS